MVAFCYDLKVNTKARLEHSQIILINLCPWKQQGPFSVIVGRLLTNRTSHTNQNLLLYSRHVWM